MFDCFVQFSPRNPVCWLQSAVGAPVDGILGPRTIAAARGHREPVSAAVRVMCQRGEYRLTHPQYSYFGKGWRSRDLNVMADAARFAGAGRA
jgi:lysozyme family protein